MISNEEALSRTTKEKQQDIKQGGETSLRRAGAEVVVGDLFEHDDAIRATAGTTGAYFCYPVRPGIIQTTAYFADAARRANELGLIAAPAGS